jgi:hypothetical protein
MAGTENLECVSIPAGADLSALQFTAVKYGTGKQVVQAAAATAPIVGILQNKPTSGQTAAVAISGIAKAKAGGVWAAGDALTATTGGALIATTTNNHHIVGYAHEIAASGDIAQVRLAPGQFGA